MICSKCGMQNMNGTKFCVKCGNSLTTQTVNYSQLNQNTGYQNVQPTSQQPYQNVSYQSTQPINQNSSYQSTNINQQMNQNIGQTSINSNMTQQTQTSGSYTNQYKNNKSTSKTIIGFISTILAVVLKPYTTFKEELDNYDDFKNSAILSLIISIGATLISLITTMINAVRVTSYYSKETKWVWENLKHLNYIQLIGKNFLIYLGIILSIAVVYYIVSLIIKKQVNFSRLLGISALAITPMLACTLILSPLLALILSELSMPIMLVGIVYTIILLYEGMNSQIKLEGNIKYYFNLICFSILMVSAYYLFMKLFMSSLVGGLSDIFDMFG